MKLFEIEEEIMKHSMSFWIAFVTLAAFVMPLAAAEYVKNGDFENGEVAPWALTKPDDKVGLAVVTDSNTPSGSGALGITLTGEARVVDLRQGVNIGPGTYKLTAYFDTTRCTAPRGYILLRLSGTVNGKWHAFGSVATPGSQKGGWKKTEWQKYEQIVTVPEGGVIKNINISFAGHLTGTAMIDGISLRAYGPEAARKHREAQQKIAAKEAEKREAQKSAPSGVLEQRKHRSLYPIDEIPELSFRLKNPAAKEVAATVRFQTRDYFGKVVKEQKKEFLLPPQGEIVELLRYPECVKPGFYAVTAQWRAGKSTGSAQGSFVKVGPVPEKRDPLFGINFFSSSDVPTWVLLGAGSKGVMFRWQLRMPYQKKALEKLQQEVKELYRNGMTPIISFRMYDGTWWTNKNFWKGFMPEKATPGKELPTVQDCEEVLVPFIEEVVRNNRKYVRHWVLGGEIDCGYAHRPDGIEHFVGMVRFSARAIHRVDPDAIVASLGVSGSDGRSTPRFPWIKKLLPMVKDDIDALAPDAYTGGQRYGKGYVTMNTEESQHIPMMKELVKLAQSTRKKLAWIDERGPSIIRSTPLDSPHGTRMANMVAREFIQLKTFPNILFWLYYRPDNWNPQNTADWGMWEKGYPRQVVSAYAATARVMAFAEFVKELPLHQDIPCLIFRKNGRYFAAVWYNGKERLKVGLPAGITTEALDVQGNPIDLAAHSLTLGEAPVYLFAESPEALGKLLANAADGVSELAFTLERLEAGKTILMIQNQSGHAIALKLEGAELPGGKTIFYQDRFKLAAGEIRSVEKPVGADHVTFRLKTDKGKKYSASATLKPVPVPRVSSFAELAEKAAPLKLDDPARQISGYDDFKVHKLYTGLDDLSGEFRLGYDDRYLYLEATVKDDIHRNDEAPGRIFSGDCIQFAVDSRRDARMKLARGVRGYSDDDFNFVAALAAGAPHLRCFIAPKAKRAELLEKDYQITPEIFRDEAAKTTTYRIRLAFADLAPLKPKKGRNFGFSLLIFDRDEPNSFYNMAFSPGVSHPFDPSKYPAFQFE